MIPKTTVNGKSVEFSQLMESKSVDVSHVQYLNGSFPAAVVSDDIKQKKDGTDTIITQV